MTDDITPAGAAAHRPARRAASRTAPGTVSLLTSPDRTYLTMTGEVDVSMNAELNHVADLAHRRGAPIDIDTRQVTFMDSAVIAVLTRLAYSLPHRLRFVAPPDQVRFLLEVTGMEEIVEVLPEEAEPTGTVDAADAAAVTQPGSV